MDQSIQNEHFVTTTVLTDSLTNELEELLELLFATENYVVEAGDVV